MGDGVQGLATVESETSTPRAGRRIRRPRADSTVFLVLIALLVVLIVYPGIRVLAQTVQGPDGFTLDWFSTALNHPAVRSAIIPTAVIVGGSTILSMVIGIPLAWVVTRTDIPFARTLDRLPLIPMLFPPLLGAMGWAFLLGPRAGVLNVLVFQPLGFTLDVYTVPGVMWVMSLYFVPWVYTIVASGYELYNTELTEASRVLGGSSIGTVLRVELPIMRPHLLAATLISFLLALSSFTVPKVLGGVVGIEVFATLIQRFTTSFRLPTQIGAVIATSILAASLIGTVVQRRLTRGNRFVSVGGRGLHQGARLRLGRLRWYVFGVVVAYFVFAIVLPVLALLYVSLLPFYTSQVSLSFLTLDNYRSVIFDASTLWASFRTSIVLAVACATITVILAGMSSFINLRTRVRGRQLLEYMGMISIGIPAIVFGLGVLLGYIRPPLALYGTMSILVVAYIGNHFVYALRSSDAALRQIDPSLEEASRVSGSSLLGSAKDVTFPLMRSGLAVGWVLSFILIFREFPMSILLASPSVSVVAVRMFDYFENGRFLEVSAFSMFVIVATLLISLLVQRLMETRVPH